MRHNAERGRPPAEGAQRLDEIFQTGLAAYVDLAERAIDAPREFHDEGDLSALRQLQDKNTFLC